VVSKGSFLLKNMVDKKQPNEDKAKADAARKGAETRKLHETDLRGGLRPLTRTEAKGADPRTYYRVPAPDGRLIAMGWVSIWGATAAGWRGSTITSKPGKVSIRGDGEPWSRRTNLGLVKSNGNSPEKIGPGRHSRRPM
jgi:hypothetical protein